MAIENHARGQASPPGPAVKEPLERARERAAAIQGLYVHVLVYLAINGGLLLINLLTRGEGGTWWFVWPVAIWGVALLIHAMATYVPVFSPEWVERRAARMRQDGSG
ncbi:MAG TPA: 2TM domain-containing protein [Actinomycetota bacterium]|nr:2TM domain-containing protein [Actinomycetota bacterium]